MTDAGMSLDDFVSQTLLAIVGGVLKAQQDAVCGAYIGRSPSQAPGMTIGVDAHGNVVSLVDFDLATTVEDKTGKGGGANIKVIPMLGVHGEANTQSASSAVSRISFKVSIAIPRPAGQKADDENVRRKSARASDVESRHERI